MYLFDQAPVSGTSLADLDWPLFERYYQAVTGEGISTDDASVQETLRGAFILTELEGKLCLTVAGLLCFGKIRNATFIKVGSLLYAFWGTR